MILAGPKGYCVGNLHIPGYEQPWEDKKFVYPDNLASPLRIIIEASNGASAYGNEFGEVTNRPCSPAYTLNTAMCD
jgi:phosphoribosylformylglycinamidine synthase